MDLPSGTQAPVAEGSIVTRPGVRPCRCVPHVTSSAGAQFLVLHEQAVAPGEVAAGEVGRAGRHRFAVERGLVSEKGRYSIAEIQKGHGIITWEERDITLGAQKTVGTNHTATRFNSGCQRHIQE